jgi:vacuolar iron transporter family protein
MSSRADPAISPVEIHHHRDVQGGTARAAVFGISDGLVSNVGLILGVAGADPAPSVVRLAGLAGLIAGAVSMAAGEYNSMKVQQELYQRELDMEREALERFPHVETVELTQIYQSKGVEADQARALAEAMMSDPERALEAHVREELGISPGNLGSPLAAASSSFVAFAIGALVPLVPWFFIGHGGAIVLSLCLAAVAAIAVGVATARFTERSRVRTVIRQVAFTMVTAGIIYSIGKAVGVTV